jgi:CMP-N-acetylneuraminic acid synthetase
MHRIVALLPMKAHSERVRAKNFRLFAGRPLFQWVLETLLSLGEIDRIIINTDARTVLAQSGLIESPRILIRDRAADLCGDHVSMNRVIADDLAAVESQTYLMTHTTNPLLSEVTLKSALAAYRDGLARGHDSLFSVNRYQARFYRADASPINHDPNKLIRTQDLEPWYEENSNLYVFSRESFARTNARIGARPMLFETPRLESADIDDQVGWSQAEIMALSRQIFRVHTTV